MRAALLSVVALSLGCISAKHQEMANSHMELGTAYLTEGNAPDALGELKEAVKLDRKSWAAWEKLALAYMAQNAMEESEVAFKKALRFSPGNAQVLNNYGLMLLRVERTDDAIAAFKEAGKDLSYRKPALVLSNLGYAQFIKGDYDAAIVTLDDAIRRAPKLCPAHFHRGLSYKAKGQLDPALKDFRAVIETCNEEAAGAYFQGAEVLASKGDQAQADEWLTAVIRLAPDTSLANSARDKLAGAGPR